MNKYFEEINGIKYITLVLTNGSKEKIRKYEELWIKIRDSIRPITKNLPLNKTIRIPVVTTVITAVFHENND